MKYLFSLGFLLIFYSCNRKEGNLHNFDKLDIHFNEAYNLEISRENRIKHVDSANEIVNQQSDDDSLKLRNVFKVANRYDALLVYDKYYKVSKKALRLSINKDDTLQIAKAEYYLGDYFFNLSKSDSAYYYYFKAKEKYENSSDKYNLAITTLHIARVLLFEKDFLGSEAQTIKALKIAQEINDNIIIYESYDLLGRVLKGQNDYEKSLDYFFKSLDQIKLIKNEINTPLFEVQAYNNIGNIFLNSTAYDKALMYYKKALKAKNIKELHPILYASVLDYYAYTNFKLKKANVIQDFKKSLNIRDSINDIAGKINSRIHLTEYYLFKKDTTTALQYNEEANRLAKESNYNKEVLQTLDFFTKLKPKEGLKYAKEYIKLSDSLQNQERLTRNKLARIEFETDEILVEKEAITSRFRIILIASLLVFSFGILFYIILYQRSKHKELLFSQEQQKANEEIYKLMLDKQDEIDEVKKKEKLRISQELHDSVMNKLAGTRLNLFILTKKRDDETIQKCLEHINGIQNIEKEIRTIAHELHNDAFFTKGSYRSLLEQMLQNQKETYQTECECVIAPDETIETISALIKMNVYRIIQESLNNINKHAKATKISLSLYIKERFLYLEIIDDGIGFKVSKSKSGIGLKNMASRSESINGKLKVSSEKNKGTKIQLKIKLENRIKIGK